MRPDQRVLVIIPAFNEELVITDTLRELIDLPSRFDILVVDDGSTDNTRRKIESIRCAFQGRLECLELPTNLGIGGAVQTGYRFAKRADCYEYVVQYDADGQHDPRSLISIVEQCDLRQLDLAIGSRFCCKSLPSDRSTLARRMGIHVLSKLVSSISGQLITDPTSGFRCASRRAWTYFASHYPDDYPEPESLLWCLRKNMRVGEIPVQMRPRQKGNSSIRNFDPLDYMSKVMFSLLIDSIRKQEPPVYEC